MLVQPRERISCSPPFARLIFVLRESSCQDPFRIRRGVFDHTVRCLIVSFPVALRIHGLAVPLVNLGLKQVPFTVTRVVALPETGRPIVGLPEQANKFIRDRHP
ncbi:MAG: hypothetical protein A3J97_02255 [Spirochaetes bacterium RIFOXYC1_FULL_54_7]|nr:MAG: hypothetical protein A3J97_02255 [Spirochaetes bacterium RIFOXYC1_FULL_54_7]